MRYYLDFCEEEMHEIISAVIFKQRETREKLNSINKYDNDEDTRKNRLYWLKLLKEQERIYEKLDYVLHEKENDCCA